MTLAIDPFYSYFLYKERVEVVYTPLHLTLYSFAYVPDPYHFSKVFLHLKVTPQGQPDLYLKTGSVAKRMGLAWSQRPVDQQQFEKLLLEKSLDTIIEYAGLADFYKQTKSAYQLSKREFVNLYSAYRLGKEVEMNEDEVLEITFDDIPQTVYRVQDACFVKGKFLANGMVKSVHVGFNFGQRKFFAIAYCDLHEPLKRELALNDLKKQLALQKISKVAKIVGYMDFPDQLVIIMPLYKPGNLLDFLNNGPQRSLDDRINLMQQMGEIVEQIHLRGIVHNDIKLENFLLDHQGWLHITDFGFSSTIEEQLYKNAGSTLEGSPEARQEMPIHYSRDIWSLGITYLILLICGTPKFRRYEDGTIDYTQVILPSPKHYIKQGKMKEAFLLKLITSMLNINPDERPTIQAVNAFFNPSGQKSVPLPI